MHIKDDKKRLPGKGQQGSVLILFAVCLFFLIGIAALAIDIGRLVTTRNELQNVADAAALAGARYLGAVYITLDPSAMGTHLFTKQEVYDAVEAVANQNKAAKQSVSIDINDVTIGLWDATKSTDDIWLETLTGPDAVTVTARRDSGVINGPITSFFARIFSINTMDVRSKKAIAALTGPAYVEDGELKTPFGLSENTVCEDTINLSPTPGSCAGWHNFLDPINANLMDGKLMGFIRGDEDVYKNLTGGEEWLSTNFDALVKSRKSSFSVIPAKAGIQSFQPVTECLDSGFHRSDDFLRSCQFWNISRWGIDSRSFGWGLFHI